MGKLNFKMPLNAKWQNVFFGGVRNVLLYDKNALTSLGPKGICVNLLHS